MDLLRNVGIKEEEIIFTSNTAYGIPIGQNIFNWLKSQITEKPFVIYLLPVVDSLVGAGLEGAHSPVRELLEVLLEHDRIKIVAIAITASKWIERFIFFNLSKIV